ncbi:unnamed protein product [Ascophyllum nodosum]
MEEGELAATSNCAIKDHAVGSIRAGPKLFRGLLELVGRRYKGKARRGDQQPSSARTGV